MRIDLKKYLFVGVEKERKAFFQRAQEIGVVHFIDRAAKSKGALPHDLQELIAAIKIVRTLPVIDQEEPEEGLDDVDSMTAKIVSTKAALEKLESEAGELELEIQRVAPFGNYAEKDLLWIESVGNRKIQFYCGKENEKEWSTLPEELIPISSANGLDYFISISREPIDDTQMIKITPQGSLGDLQERQLQLQSEIQEKERWLKSQAKYNAFFHNALIVKLNHTERFKAENLVQLPLESAIFTVEGWVPVDSIEELSTLAESLNVYIAEIAIEPLDSIPTCLKNRGLSRIGEDLVQIYDTPSAEDKDPSLWVLSFFALFFAMIIGDAGYGMVLLLVSLYAKSKQGRLSGAWKRFFYLSYILSVSVIVWGALTTSFFGLSVPIDSPLREISFVNWLVKKKATYHFKAQDSVAKEWIAEYPSLEGKNEAAEILQATRHVDPKSGAVEYKMYTAFSNNIMLEFALFVGIVHIVLSLLRYLKRNIAAIGWVAVLIGGYLYIPKILDATTFTHFVFGFDRHVGEESGIVLLYGGLAFACIASILKYGFLGVVETLSTVIQLFGDSMSYLRLYALGLSGALVTATINDLVSGMNVVIAVALLIVGHCINLGLGIMGGVIHGLRLNFLEWYHYSFEGDGKRFEPLCKIEVD